jgi:predicted Zn-dependent protease with MMP-like domain
MPAKTGDMECETGSAEPDLKREDLIMRAADFDQIVEQAFRHIPARFRSRMQNVAVVVEDEPPPQRRRIPYASTLLGLYEGRPLACRGVSEGFQLPDRITIYQGPHERMARNREDLERLVEQTLWHEIAHHFGMNEREVRAAERLRRKRRLWPH